VAGSVDKNDLQLDMCEALELFGKEKVYLINTVTNIYGQVLKAYSGCPLDAYEKACEHVVKQYSIGNKLKFDIVLACASGFPSDNNFYQSQKAYDIAQATLKSEGHFYLIAECSDGVGEDINLYKNWLNLNNEELVESLKKYYHNLAVGPFRINMLKEMRCKLNVVTNYLAEMKDFIGMDLVAPKSLDHNLKECISEYNKKGIIPKVGIIPFASHCVVK
jgi:nickel-dependent lactate racemase